MHHGKEAPPRLVWPGKNTTVCHEVRTLRARASYTGTGAAQGGDCRAALSDGWRNLLVHADNRPLLSTLQNGPLFDRIKAAGGIKLIYCDPPFAVGTRFTMPVTGRGQGDGAVRTVYALAYEDAWEKGLDSYLNMLFERLRLMRSLLAGDGSFYLHCDWRVASHLRLLMDEIFGSKRFLGDIVWHYTGGGRSRRYFSRKHDRILHYAVSDRWIFNADAVRVPYKESSGYAKKGITSAAGKRYFPHPDGTPVDDVWDIPMINPLAGERTGYPTQKPESLLERIIAASSNPGDLVADFFCGSGTTAAVAEKMGRKWIAADSSPLAVHTARKRMLTERKPAGSARRAKPASHAPAFVLADLESPDAMRNRVLADGRGPFQHTAVLGGLAVRYVLADIRVRVKRLENLCVFELAGFSAQECASCPQSAAAVEGTGPEGERVRFAALLERGWRALLDSWSVGLPAEPFDAAAGIRAAALHNIILWQDFSRRGHKEPALSTPALFLPAPRSPGGRAARPCLVVVTVIDIFGNESPFLLGTDYL